MVTSWLSLGSRTSENDELQGFCFCTRVTNEKSGRSGLYLPDRNRRDLCGCLSNAHCASGTVLRQEGRFGHLGCKRTDECAGDSRSEYADKAS